jgi:hypothetical protein
MRYRMAASLMVCGSSRMSSRDPMGRIRRRVRLRSRRPSRGQATSTATQSRMETSHRNEQFSFRDALAGGIRPGFAREPGRFVCKIICTFVCPTLPATPVTMSCTTSLTTRVIGTAQSSYASFSTSHSSASDTRWRSTGPNSTIFFVESAWGRCSRPICNFAKSCWGRRHLSSAAGPGSARSRAFAGLLIRRSHRNHRHLPLL